MKTHVENAYDISNMVNGYVYIGRSGNIIALGYADLNRDDALMLFYDTEHLQKAGYFICQSDRNIMQLFMEGSLSNVCADGYCKVDSLSILKVVKDLENVIK